MPYLACKATYISSFDGEKIFTVAEGNLENPHTTVVFLSGLGGGVTSIIFPIEELLRKDPEIRCITLDLRGHSLSSHIFPKKKPDLFTVLSEDLSIVCQHYKLEKPIIVGHSLGGLVLHSYLSDRRVPPLSHAIFVATPISGHYLPFAIHSFVYSVLSRLSGTFCPLPAMPVRTHLYYKNSSDLSPGRIFNDLKTVGIVEYIFIWLSVFSWRIPRYTSELEKKMTFVFGEKDIVVNTSEQNSIRKKFPFATFRSVDSNHNVIVNAPKELAEIIYLQIQKLRQSFD